MSAVSALETGWVKIPLKMQDLRLKKWRVHPESWITYPQTEWFNIMKTPQLVRCGQNLGISIHRFGMTIVKHGCWVQTVGNLPRFQPDENGGRAHSCRLSAGKTLILQRFGHFSDVYGITILVGYVIPHFG